MSAELSPTSLENITRVELLHKKKKKEAQLFEILDQFKGREGLFIKGFFVDETLNANNWRVTDEAKERDIKTGMETDYFGKTAPIILRDDFGHPPDDSDDIVAEQELDRVGDFIGVGIDPNTKHAFFVAQITKVKGIKAIQDGKVSFLSPSLRSLSEFHTFDGEIVITRFKINHVALVKEPAFGRDKAQIRGHCAGTPETCLTQLSNVQAETYQAAPRIVYNTQGDSKVDARICKALDGAVFNSGNKNRLLIPDDTHPNCRCFWTLQGTGEILGQDPIDKAMETALENIELGRETIKEIEREKKEELKGTKNENASMESSFNGRGISIAKCDKTGNLIIELQGQTPLQKFVSDCISEKLSKGQTPTAQDLAICFSEGREKGLSGKSESLKTKRGKKKSMADETDEEKEKREKEEAKRAQEEEEKDRKEKEDQARRAQEEKDKKDKDENQMSTEDIVKKLDDQDKEIKALQDVVDEEIKEPLAAKIIEARVKMGKLKEADLKQARKDLMGKQVSELKSLAGDYTAMSDKIKDATIETSDEVKYQFQASDEKSDEKALLSSIRSRMN